LKNYDFKVISLFFNQLVQSQGSAPSLPLWMSYTETPGLSINSHTAPPPRRPEGVMSDEVGMSTEFLMSAED